MNYKVLFCLFILFCGVSIPKNLAQDNESEIIVSVEIPGMYKLFCINKTLKTAKELDYDHYYELSDSVIVVRSNDKYGLIDGKGKVIAPLQYDYMNLMNDHYNGYIIVGISKDKSKIDLESDLDSGSIKKGLIDENGNVVIPIKYDKIKDFSEGLAMVYSEEHGNDPYFVDGAGNTVVSGYQYALPFSEGLAGVGKNETNPYKGQSIITEIIAKEKAKNKHYGLTPSSDDEIGIIISNTNEASEQVTKYGFVDKNNKVIIPIKYDKVGSFSEGLACVNYLGRTGFIDKTGKTIIPFEFDNMEAEGFKDGFAIIRVNFFKTGVINKSGKVIIPPQYQEVKRVGKFWQVTNFDNKVGLFDNEGKEIIPVENYNINYVEDDVFSVFNTKINNGWGYETKLVNNRGENITDETYPDISVFSDGMAKINLQLKDNEGYYDDKYGFINTKGEMVIDAIYDEAESFSEGLAKVQLNIKNGYNTDKKYGFINTKGEVIIDIIYNEAESFSEGLARVMNENHQWGYINTEGQVVTPIKYRKAHDFKKGFALVYDSDYNKFLLDTQGNEYKVERVD